jgi:hypothetical protein
VGTVLFATYLLLRIKLPARSVAVRSVVRVGLIGTLCYLQPTLTRAAGGFW